MPCNKQTCADIDDDRDKIEIIKESVGTIPDFPKPGIIFK